MAKRRFSLRGLFDAIGRVLNPAPPPPKPTLEQEAAEFRRLLPAERRPTPTPVPPPRERPSRQGRLLGEAEKYRPEVPEPEPESEECYDEKLIDYKHVRTPPRELVTRDAVENYYRDIPVPTLAFQRCSDGRWLLAVGGSDELPKLPKPRKPDPFERFTSRLSNYRPRSPKNNNLSGLLSNTPRQVAKEKPLNTTTLNFDILRKNLGL